MRAGIATCALGLILGLMVAAYAFYQEVSIESRESSFVSRIEADVRPMPQELYDYLTRTITDFERPWMTLTEVALSWSAICLAGLIFESLKKRRS
jgi:hypothetical protein